MSGNKIRLYNIFSKLIIICFMLVLLNKIDANVQRSVALRSVDNDYEIYDNKIKIPVERTIEDAKNMHYIGIDNAKDVNSKENEITERTTVASVNHKNSKRVKIKKIKKVYTKKKLKSGNQQSKYNEDIGYNSDEIVKTRSKETKSTTEFIVVVREKIESYESENRNMGAAKNVDFSSKEIVKSENEQRESIVLSDEDMALTENFISSGDGKENFIVLGSHDGFRRQMSWKPPKPYKESERPESVCREEVHGTSYFWENVKDSEPVEEKQEYEWREINVYPNFKNEYRRCSFDKRFECVFHRVKNYNWLRKKEVVFGVDRCCRGYMEDDVRPRDEQGRLVCTPNCNPYCVRARCMKGNICICHAGYKKLEGKNHICIPRCYKDCGGKSRGECIAPNVCFCKRGYEVTEIYVQEKGNFSMCVTQCPNPPCVNSICIGPQICKCLERYKPHKTLRHMCDPVCKYTHHGKCIAPEVAICNKGYHRTDGKCFAICDKHCGLNGTCVADGDSFSCECDLGYKFDSRIQECKPQCRNCSEGGYCVKPDKCICVSGYMSTKEGGCVFSCNFECGLGRCVGPNKCLCPRGYIFNKTAEGSKCVPFCRGCELGECISPRNCQCPRGYVYHVPKVGEDRRIKCIKTVKSYRYYDDRECKSMYDRLRRMWEHRQLMERVRKAKLKWEQNRRKLKKEYEEKMLKENRTREKAQAKYVKFKVQRRKDKKLWLKQQRQYNQDRLERERKEDDRIKKMHVEYRKEFKKPAVTWRNFARVAAASLYIGPYGIVFW